MHVPMHWLMAGSHQLLHLVGSHNYLALFVMILLEEAGCPLPLPGESLIVYAGSRLARGEMSLMRVFAAVLPASAIGCSILYYVARIGGRALLRKIGPRIHFQERQLDRLESKAGRLGPVGVLLGRLTPGIRVPTGVAAGIFRVPFRYYLPFALLATCLRLAFFLYVGATAQRVRAAVAFTRDVRFLAALGVLALAAAAVCGWRRFRPRLKSESVSL